MLARERGSVNVGVVNGVFFRVAKVIDVDLSHVSLRVESSVQLYHSLIVISRHDRGAVQCFSG
eukprot:15428767-Heterocapsa_arctica.AAC.1